MEPLNLFILSVIIIIGWWRYKKRQEKARFVSERLRKDSKLYQHLKKGVREHDWRMRQSGALKEFLDAEEGTVLFENADMIEYKLKHFAESRIGFYFKDINEYGIYGFFVGNDVEVDVFVSYYRTDKNFGKEERLIYDDE